MAENELTYEQKVQKLDEIVTRLNNSEMPIDKLAEDLKVDAKLIKELTSKLKQVEMEVCDAFKELEEELKGIAIVTSKAFICDK
jgi:exodeoxyribonuclease VII small subunit